MLYLSYDHFMSMPKDGFFNSVNQYIFVREQILLNT